MELGKPSPPHGGATEPALREHSFAMYTKEYDVFTGDLKQRFDEKRLRDEEDVA